MSVICIAVAPATQFNQGYFPRESCKDAMIIDLRCALALSKTGPKGQLATRTGVED